MNWPRGALGHDGLFSRHDHYRALVARGIVLGAGTLALATECSRLYHTPELDAYRLTTAGALLLGRVFSLWNLVAYVLGIALGAALDAGVPGCWKRDQGVTPKPKTPSNSDQRLA